jgi:hypothetical protein
MLVKRFLAVLGVTTFLAVGVCAVNPAAASQEPLMTGAVNQGGESVISAHGLFTAAHGELTNPERLEPGSARVFHATVTCLEVTGNVGIATAVVDSSHVPGILVGETVVAEGVDNGSLGTNDLFRISFEHDFAIFPDMAHPGCFLPFLPPAPIQSGNILVSPGS